MDVSPNGTSLGNEITGDEIQIPSQAQGDILYFNGTAWARLGAGTSGQYLKTLGAGANPAWAGIESFTYLEKLTFAGDSTKTTGALAAYDEYLIVFTKCVTSANGNIILRINGDTGNNYANAYIDSTTPVWVASASSALLYAPGTDYAQEKATGVFRVGGITGANAGGKLHGAGNATNGTNGGMVYGFRWTGGASTQITSFTVLMTSGTLTGTVEIFGRNTN